VTGHFGHRDVGDVRCGIALSTRSRRRSRSWFYSVERRRSQAFAARGHPELPSQSPTRAELAVGYQRGNVLAIRYAAHSIPDEMMLTDDLVQLSELLAVLYDTPGAPEYSHTTTKATIGKPPGPNDEDAFVDWVRNTYGPTLVPTRAAAEQQARELLEEHAGTMTVDQAVLLGQLFNMGEWGGIARQNRFLPAFAGANMEGLLDPIEVFNEVTNHLWRDPIDDAIALVDRILISKEVLPGAGRSYPTMLLYLRDSERFAIWLQATHRGLQAFGRLDEPVGRKGGCRPLPEVLRRRTTAREGPPAGTPGDRRDPCRSCSSCEGPKDDRGGRDRCSD